MQAYDPQKAARVWQRVQGQQESPKPEERRDDYQELVMNEALSAAACQQLARQMGQKDTAAALQRMAREERRHAACLRGMQVLVTGQRTELRLPQPETEPPERALRRCYAAALRSMRTYETRADDGEYGAVFAELARQEREHCCLILELLGGLGKK